MEAFNQWLQRLNERMAIKSGIFVCERIIRLSPHIHYVEWMQMHDLAVVVQEKLRKDLDELRTLCLQGLQEVVWHMPQ